MGLVNMTLCVTAEEAAQLADKILAGIEDPQGKLYDPIVMIGLILDTASRSNGLTAVSSPIYESPSAYERTGKQARLTDC